MRNILILIFILLLHSIVIFAQDKSYDRDNILPKLNGIEDRAAGIHNASNIGLFFENRGKLYPRRITQGPSGEFPINSTKHYIYRINQLVGIPGNVIQARYTDNEEWEALGGFHNPSLAKVAMSDNPSTWHPENGWPIKDKNGNPIFKSDQDSYCAYDDLNNSRRYLKLQLTQTGYTYGVQAAENIIFFKYDITNNSSQTYEGVYFGLYTDIDVGNISGGAPEYGDDKIGFDKERNYLYFYDDGVSNEWPGNTTGYMGVAFIKTPEIDGRQAGVTDMHYNLYFDDEDQDTIQYGIMSSSESLFNSAVGSRYFHLGDNENLHYDDPATIPESGLDIVATISSGPYSLAPGDTLTFVTAIIAGETLEDSYETLNIAEDIVSFDFDFIRPPVNSNLGGIARDGKAYLYWDDIAEGSYDKFTKEYDFEGYRVYRSIDKGINWNLLADYDIKNFIGNDTGLQYSFVDSTVTNGFEYWYSVTAYDRGSDLTGSLESPKGNSVDAINLVALTPQSGALGYIPVTTDNVEYIGNGTSNYLLEVQPADDNSLAGNNYKIQFGFATQREIGEFFTETQVNIKDSALTTQNDYRVEFLAPNKLQIVDVATGDYLQPSPKSYFSGATYSLNDGISVTLTEPDEDDFEAYPQNGDIITVKFAQTVIRNDQDTIVSLRPFDLTQHQTTPDGILYNFIEPDIISDISRIGGSDNIELFAEVSSEVEIMDESYLIHSGKAELNSDNEITVYVIVESSAGDTLVAAENIKDDPIYFNGIEITLEYSTDDLPEGSNMFSITTQKSILPNLQDSYLFSVKGSSVNPAVFASGLSDIKVVPNPYIVSSLFEPEFGELRREPLRQIQFINLPNECTIYIFSIDADLVKTLYHDSVTGTEIWDLRAEGGREIAAGIYIYVVKTQNDSFKDRFAIIK